MGGGDTWALWLVVCAGGGLALFCAVYFGIWAPRSKRRANASWSKVARRLDGTFGGLDFGGKLVGPRPVIEGSLGSLPVRVEQVPESVGEGVQLSSTRIVIPCPDAGFTALRVSKAKTMGARPGICTGDAEFDEAYRVTGSPAPLARAWVTPRVRRAILGLADYDLSVEDGLASATYGDLETDPRRMLRAAKTTGGLVRAIQKARATESQTKPTDEPPLCSSCVAKAQLFDGMAPKTRGLRKVLGFKPLAAFKLIVALGMVTGIGYPIFGHLLLVSAAYSLIAVAFVFLLAGYRGGAGRARRIRQALCAVPIVVCCAAAVFPNQSAIVWDVVGLILEAG